MAERQDPRRYAGPIVPDPEASLTAQRHRYPEPPTVWPLWLLVMLLAAGLGAAGWFGWQERQRLSAEVARLGGELSNVHARFDTALGEGDALQELGQRVAAQAEENATQERRFEVLEEDLAAGLDALGAGIERLEGRLSRMGEAAATREAMLAAFQDSLDALERAGEEGRAALEERMARLDAANDGDAAVLEGLRESLAALESRLAATREAGEEARDALERRLAALDEAVEGVAEAREDSRQERDALRTRLAALEAEAGELRRSQLALSARLEALRP